MNKITIPRIAFAVMAGLILIGFLKAAFFAGTGWDEGMMSMIIGLTALALSVLMTLIGSTITIWSQVKRRPITFWLTATTVAALPIIVFVVNGIYYSVTGRDLI